MVCKCLKIIPRIQNANNLTFLRKLIYVPIDIHISLVKPDTQITKPNKIFSDLRIHLPLFTYHILPQTGQLEAY